MHVPKAKAQSIVHEAEVPTERMSQKMMVSRYENVKQYMSQIPGE